MSSIMGPHVSASMSTATSRLVLVAREVALTWHALIVKNHSILLFLKMFFHKINFHFLLNCTYNNVVFQLTVEKWRFLSGSPARLG